jgi:hypothetical protein
MRLLAGFFLEGGQVGQLAQGGHHRQDGVQLGHLGHVRLDEDDALFRADAGGQPVQGHLVGIFAQVVGVFNSGQRVQIHDAVDTVVLILQGDVILDRPQVIAQVLPPGGASARKNTAFLGSCHTPSRKTLRSRRTTSPGSAWRCSRSLENISLSFTLTSNCPPSPGVRVMVSISGSNSSSSSAVRPTARSV